MSSVKPQLSGTRIIPPLIWLADISSDTLKNAGFDMNVLKDIVEVEIYATSELTWKDTLGNVNTNRFVPFKYILFLDCASFKTNPESDQNIKNVDITPNKIGYIILSAVSNVSIPPVTLCLF